MPIHFDYRKRPDAAKLIHDSPGIEPRTEATSSATSTGTATWGSWATATVCSIGNVVWGVFGRRNRPGGKDEPK